MSDFTDLPTKKIGNFHLAVQTSPEYPYYTIMISMRFGHNWCSYVDIRKTAFGRNLDRSDCRDFDQIVKRFEHAVLEVDRFENIKQEYK